MNDPIHITGRVLPSNRDDLEHVLQAAGHAVSCAGGLLMAGDALGWDKVTSFGGDLKANLGMPTEAWLRMATSYGDVVRVGVDMPAHKLDDGAAQLAVCVAIRGAQQELLGAFLLTSPATSADLSPAQRYALQTHAAHMGGYLKPSLRPEAIEQDKRTVERLRLLESVVINAKDAILITEAEPIDRPGPRIVYCNPAFLEVTGFSETEVIGQTPRILQCAETSRETLDQIRHALSHWQPVEVELINTRKDGSRFWVELSIVPVANEKGWFTHWVSVQRDVTERKEAQRFAQQARVEWEEKLALQSRLEERERIADELSYIAFHDELTALFNRTYLMSELQKTFSQPALANDRATILFLDLDGFKLVNDSLGHMAGDQLLTWVARRLQACIRSTDVLARIGGDEFAILVMGEDQPQVALDLAKRIVAQLHTPMSLEGQDIFISCSIGVVTADASHENPEDLLRDADVAMYAAKKQGRGRWSIFDSSMRKAVIDALVIQNALRQSVTHKEFLVFYQPIYCGSGAQLIGVEALVRWAHPQLGIVAPDVFISIAEDLGLIQELGAWVMRKACAQVQTWRKDYPDLDLKLNVNVSGKELNRPGYAAQVAQILSDTGLLSTQLQIEVTESVFLQQPESVAHTLEDIRCLGVRVALDDFGTGYSSLGYIDRFPIDAVKIDRSFVSRMMSYPRSEAIVESILSLGRALQLDITAEGIETAAQFERLRDMQCPYFQGYFFSPPVRPEGLVKLITAARLKAQANP